MEIILLYIEGDLCADLQLVMRSGDGWQQPQQRRSDCCLQGCQVWQHPCVTLPHLWGHHWYCLPGSLYPRQQLPFWMDQVTKGHFSHPMTHMGLSTRHMLIMPTTQRWRHLHFLQIMPQRNTRVGCLHVDIDSPSPPYLHGWRETSPRPKLYSSHRTTRMFACWQIFLPYLSSLCLWRNNFDFRFKLYMSPLAVFPHLYIGGFDTDFSPPAFF